ncbi:mitochondrial nucleoid-associated protein 1 [Ambystoma mexicanum]|uniref:mitochondrial nucleoid-associated protein 1 n=1 Tax=Ambystoma mexicanum TaxID=8296 RepID=UPI0037E8E944
MAGGSTGMELCPHCGKPFKRLKSHLPHCKMADKVPSPSATAMKPKHGKIEPTAKEKKQGKKVLAPRQAMPREEGYKGQAWSATNTASEKAESVQMTHKSGTKTSDVSLMKKRRDATGPVKVAKKSVAGLELRADVVHSPTKAKGREPQDISPLNRSRGQHIFGTEDTLANATAGGLSVENLVLQGERDVFVGSAIKPEVLIEHMALSSWEEHNPIVVLQTYAQEQNIVQQKQRSTVHNQTYDASSTSYLFTNECQTKASGQHSLGIAEPINLLAKKDWGDTLVGAEHEAMDMFHSGDETARNSHASIEKGKDGRPSVKQTSVSNHVEDPLQKSMVKSSGGDYPKKESGQERSSVEEEYLKDFKSYTESREPLPIFQTLDPGDCPGALVDTNQNGERSRVLMTCLQQLPEKGQPAFSRLSQFYLDEAKKRMIHSKDLNPCFSSHPQDDQLLCSTRVPREAVGLHWIPEFYFSYQHLQVVPRKYNWWGKEILSTASNHLREELERRLMKVPMGELPSWMATRLPSHRALAAAAQKAWSRYYTKYINVKRGGVGSITMLLAGYCALSYAWNYQPIRKNYSAPHS